MRRRLPKARCVGASKNKTTPPLTGDVGFNGVRLSLNGKNRPQIHPWEYLYSRRCNLHGVAIYMNSPLNYMACISSWFTRSGKYSDYYLRKHVKWHSCKKALRIALVLAIPGGSGIHIAGDPKLWTVHSRLYPHPRSQSKRHFSASRDLQDLHVFSPLQSPNAQFAAVRIILVSFTPRFSVERQSGKTANMENIRHRTPYLWKTGCCGEFHRIRNKNRFDTAENEPAKKLKKC